MGQTVHHVSIVVKELPPIPGEPRILKQTRVGEMSLIFSKPLIHSMNAISAAPDVAAFVVQWIESRHFLPDYLDSLSPEISAAIQPISTTGGLFSNHLSSAVALSADANNQVRRNTESFKEACLKDLDESMALYLIKLFNGNK
ncbi:unnamed protein product [Hymenolepis diminuta]|uniref:Uncharacterized protein n=1 Tax=Hymenolepis diminuta TaxID=6216 RepID=A0A564ZA38_HYMDI|nr:unnamed protein product [Hymenolepis diminuta]